MITVKDLQDQIGMNGIRPFLFCEVCQAEYSANAADYFMARPSHVFSCCDVPMQMVVKEIHYRKVKQSRRS